MLHKSFRNGKNTVGLYSCTYIKYSQCCMNKSSDVMISGEFLNLAMLDMRVSLFSSEELGSFITSYSSKLTCWGCMCCLPDSQQRAWTITTACWWRTCVWGGGSNTIFWHSLAATWQLTDAQGSCKAWPIPKQIVFKQCIFATTKKNWEAVRLL